MHKILGFALLVCLLLIVPGPASAGTAGNPEVFDQTREVDVFGDPGDPTCTSACLNEKRAHLDVAKAWIEPRGGDFHFTIELRDMREVIDIPKDAVYVFHYTWQEARLYWRANWSADKSAFEYIGGVYAGCKPPVCQSHDSEGNKQYAYLPGNASLKDSLSGEVTPGAPGRITWKYPIESYGNREGLTFKGIFIITYEKGSQNQLQYIDTAQSQRDYEHQVYIPWWRKFVPGPSPVLIAAGALAVVALAARNRRDA